MPITPQINDILTWLLHQEDANLSGKVVNLDDGAGWTRLGITSRDAAFFNGDFSQYPTSAALDAAKIFYYQKYWLPLGLDNIVATYAASILSCAVNCGLTAAKALWDRSNSQSDFIANWKRHYDAIVRNRPEDERFLNGWYKRADTIYVAPESN